jgi:phosphoglucosamine mutase
VEPNGFNINNNIGSTYPDSLRAKVLEMRADVGIALDGDADRVVMVDETGQLIDGDQLMAVVASSWAKQGLLSKQGKDGGW